MVEPALNQVLSVELGDPFLTKKYAPRVPTVDLLGQMSHAATHRGINLEVKVPAGRLTEWAKGELGTYYESPGFISQFNSMGSVHKLEGAGGIIVPPGATSTNLTYRLASDGITAFVGENAAAIGVARAPDKILSREDSYTRELIYTGASGKTITLLYREYVNDLARPAFSQELKYDLNEGRVVGFKGARFEVIDASNTAMRFKVLKHLD